ncbi:MAG: EscU/YscU/HrcU family type III secretion system export apparatus switch protein [Acidobacteria bacterium]|nr:MAG: EscU/YscU/HrcU family type III secretion system export apparatus switch protein [Acidobacteriota bacterium]
MANSEKTEPGTAHRREEARKEGQVARGRDLPGAVGLLAAIAVMAWGSSGGVAQWRRLMAALLQQATTPGLLIGWQQFRSTFLLTLEWSAAMAAAAWICGTAVAFQGGFVFSGKALAKLSRLSPVENVKNIFSPATLSKTAKSIIPAGVMAWLTWSVLAGSWNQLIQSGSMSVPEALAWTVKLCMAMAWRGGLVLLIWSGADYLLQRLQHEQSLKMTKQEVKEDNKETQGNPETRGRVRRIQRQMARRRMMRDVPLASVVIVNPTEYAVALRYDPAVMAAPVVVAKGRNLVAARIRFLAVRSGVPIVEDRPLARALYGYVEIGAPIPGRLYTAVAEILAFLHRQARWRAG